jgi:predicted small lipoprotein YifL
MSLCRSIVAASLALLATSACGLKGPLYLPDPPAATVPAGSPAPEDPAQKKDRPNRSEPAQEPDTPVAPPDPDRPADRAQQ